MIAPEDPPPKTDEAPEFRVRLEEVFTGPLDLLLHLVRESEVEISEVSLARVCGDFLGYVRALSEVDLALAGDYLVVAATLVAIKSRALVSNGEEVELEDDGEPTDDLVRRLLQYRRVREASRHLSGLADRRSSLFPRGENEVPRAEPGETDLGDATAWELLAAFAAVLRETGTQKPTHRVGLPARRVADYIRDAGARLSRVSALSFRELLGLEPGCAPPERGDVIGLFLALLELAKQGAVRARQDGMFGEIRVERAIEDVERFAFVIARIADPESGIDEEVAEEEGEAISTLD